METAIDKINKISELNLEFLMYVRDRSAHDFEKAASDFQIPAEGLACLLRMCRSDLRYVAAASRPLFVLNVPGLAWNRVLHRQSLRHIHPRSGPGDTRSGVEEIPCPDNFSYLYFINLEFLLAARESARKNLAFSEMMFCASIETLEAIASMRRSDIYQIAQYSKTTFALKAPARVWRNIIEKGMLRIALRRIEWKKESVTIV